MKLTLSNTSKIVEVNGVPGRVWEGTTESGIEVSCIITRIAVAKTADCSQFEAELQETRPPSINTDAFPMKMVL